MWGSPAFEGRAGMLGQADHTRRLAQPSEVPAPACPPRTMGGGSTSAVAEVNLLAEAARVQMVRQRGLDCLLTVLGMPGACVGLLGVTPAGAARPRPAPSEWKAGSFSQYHRLDETVMGYTVRVEGSIRPSPSSVRGELKTNRTDGLSVSLSSILDVPSLG